MDTATSLREEKKARTRDRIMRALAEEVLEKGPHDLSVQGVADRAGVSHRTVYRYFPSKDELFQGYGAWLDEILGSREMTPSGLDGLEAGATATLERFDDHPELVEAYVRIHGTGQTLDVRKERSAMFLELISQEASDLDEPHRRALAALLRQILNSQTWATARQEFDVGGEPLRNVTSWLIRTIVNAVQTGEVPDDWKGD